VNVQGDEPLMNPDTIDSTIRPMLADATIDIGTACCPGSDAGDLANPNVVKVVRTLTGRALYFSRAPIPFGRDVAPIDCLPAMRKHLGIYAYRAEALHRFAELPESVFEQLEKLEQLRALENGMHIHVTDVPHDSHAVDVPDDVARILEIMSH
jgi:3-deoxy-manno-octulosonate cytidylyltransferase (CMP-KDO synthetase)